MKTVLLFETNKTLRALYKEELEDEGYHVYLAKDTMEALALLKKMPVNILITEYELEPTETYLNLLNLAREIRHIPVIIFTCCPRTFIDCAWWGEMEYVSKTSNLDVLKETMREMLDYKGCIDRFYGSRGSLKQQELFF